MNEFFRELGDRKVSIAVFATVCGALIGAGVAIGGALFELSNVSKKVNVMVGKVNLVTERVSYIEGQQLGDSRVIRAVSNQAAQNATYINLLAEEN